MTSSFKKILRMLRIKFLTKRVSSYIGFFRFENFTEWRCFVTYLSNHPRKFNMYPKIYDEYRYDFLENGEAEHQSLPSNLVSFEKDSAH